MTKHTPGTFVRPFGNYAYTLALTVHVDRDALITSAPCLLRALENLIDRAECCGLDDFNILQPARIAVWSARPGEIVECAEDWKPVYANAFRDVLSHFRRRHDGRGFEPVRGWIEQARLIRAAPMILRAAAELLDYCERNLDISATCRGQKNAEAMDEARAAILSATGGEHE